MVMFMCTKMKPDIVNGHAPELSIDQNGTVYAGHWRDEKFVAVDSNGELRWETDTINAGYHHSPAISPDGTIYVSTTTGRILYG